MTIKVKIGDVEIIVDFNYEEIDNTFKAVISHCVSEAIAASKKKGR